MISTKCLTRVEDFRELKKGDDLIIIWNPEQKPWNNEMKGRKTYKILDIKEGTPHSPYPDEIILKKQGNIFFNFRFFLNGESKIVKEVYLITEYPKPVAIPSENKKEMGI